MNKRYYNEETQMKKKQYIIEWINKCALAVVQELNANMKEKKTKENVRQLSEILKNEWYAQYAVLCLM